MKRLTSGMSLGVGSVFEPSRVSFNIVESFGYSNGFGLMGNIGLDTSENTKSNILFISILIFRPINYNILWL